MINIGQSVRSSTVRRARNNSIAAAAEETVNAKEVYIRDSISGLNLANPNLILNEAEEGEDKKSRQ